MVPPLVDPLKHHPTGVNAISCGSASFCVLVGNGYIWHYDGTSVTYTRRDPHQSFTSVSCVESGFCVASDAVGRAFQYQDGVWSKVLQPLHHGYGYVSCATAAYCVLVNGSGKSSTWDGATWSDPVRIHSHIGTVVGVSCPTEQCTALTSTGSALLQPPS